MTSKIFKQRLVSETSVFDNSTDSERRVGISAEVTVQEGRVTSVNSGTVTALSDEKVLVDFSQHSAGRLNFRVRSNSDIANSEILADVEAFIADVAANVSTEEA